MPRLFENSLKNLRFDYYPALPKRAKRRINLKALFLYSLYRNALYDSYRQLNVAKDIHARPSQYQEESNAFRDSGLYNDPLYHYSVAVSLDAMKEWKTEMKCYTVSRPGEKTPIGFVHFTEQEIDGRRVVYIAQMGTSIRGQGLGQELMERVLSHYDAGTEFFVLTRVFNDPAKILYQNKLGFNPISESQVRQLNYDARYCGFNHVTTEAEIAAIKAKQNGHPVREEPRGSNLFFNLEGR